MVVESNLILINFNFNFAKKVYHKLWHLVPIFLFLNHKQPREDHTLSIRPYLPDNILPYIKKRAPEYVICIKNTKAIRPKVKKVCQVRPRLRLALTLVVIITFRVFKSTNKFHFRCFFLPDS